MNNLDKIEKFYGLSISNERRKNLEKYEKIFNISIDTSLSENSSNKSLHYYKSNNLIVKDWRGSLGSVGCALSFHNIYKDIVKNKYQYSIIFEDDIDWNEEFYEKCCLETLHKNLNKLPFDNSWDICYLGTESMGALENQTHIHDNIYELECGKIIQPIKNKTFKEFDKSRRTNSRIKHNNFGGQQAFILTYKGALKLLKYHEPAYAVADGITGYAIMNGDIINRSFVPTLFTQLSHPRIARYDNKLWASSTGTPRKTSEKYSSNMKKNKKGCSKYPMSLKYQQFWKDYWRKHN